MYFHLTFNLFKIPVRIIQACDLIEVRERWEDYGDPVIRILTSVDPRSVNKGQNGILFKILLQNANSKSLALSIA